MLAWPHSKTTASLFLSKHNMQTSLFWLSGASNVYFCCMPCLMSSCLSISDGNELLCDITYPMSWFSYLNMCLKFKFKVYGVISYWFLYSLSYRMSKEFLLLFFYGLCVLEFSVYNLSSRELLFNDYVILNDYIWVVKHILGNSAKADPTSLSSFWESKAKLHTLSLSQQESSYLLLIGSLDSFKIKLKFGYSFPAYWDDLSKFAR